MRTPAPPWSRPLRSLRTRGLAVGLAAAFLALAPASSAAADDAVFPSAAVAAPEVTSQPASPGNDLAPRWSFAGPEGATFECALAQGETLVGDWAPCVSPAAYDLSSEPDGAYLFSVRARGADGTLSEAASGEYVLDTSVPRCPRS